VPRGRTVGSDVARYGEHDPRRLCRTVAGCRWPGSVAASTALAKRRPAAADWLRTAT